MRDLAEKDRRSPREVERLGVDVGKFDELIEQAEMVDPEISGEAADLLALARGLKSLKLPEAALSVEAEDRIFAKLAALEPELAQEPEAADQLAAAEANDPALALIAERLQSLEPAAFSPEVEDRIFEKIQQKVGSLEPVRRSRIAAFKGSLAASMPRVLIQRQANAFASLIDDMAQGRTVAATGETKKMLELVFNMQPVPEVAPSESFVDWLEVRLNSNNVLAAEEETEGVLDRIGGLLRSGKFQAGLAGASAMLALAAGLTLRPGDEPRTVTNKTQPVPVASAPVVPSDAGPSVPASADSTLVAQVSKTKKSGQTGTNSGSGQGNAGGGSTDNGGGGGSSDQADPTDSAFATDVGNTVIDRALDSLGGNK